ncbi:MAG: hypothetical protein U0470_04580 [Anaerolineae bacterium]
MLPALRGPPHRSPAQRDLGAADPAASVAPAPAPAEPGGPARAVERRCRDKDKGWPRPRTDGGTNREAPSPPGARRGAAAPTAGPVLLPEPEEPTAAPPAAMPTVPIVPTPGP